MAEPIIQPVPFTEAFMREDEVAVLSQAASLLVLGAQLDEEPIALETVAGLEGGRGPMELAPPEDVEPLQVPRVAPSRDRFELGPLLDLTMETARVEPEAIRETSTEVLPTLARAVQEDPSAIRAATLIEASTHHPDEIVRVAAAIAALPTVADPLPKMHILAEATRSEDPLTRDLAATGLARFDPGHSALAELRRPSSPSGQGEPSHTSLLVHGTFASQSSWWQPGGDFHHYLLTQVRPQLYSAADRFEWSGGYSDAARAIAARDLLAWVDQHNLQGLEILAHSHGGNAAMLSSHQGLHLDQLVLLSCPVHWNKYSPDFTRVQKVVSIRVRFDLVIFADRGGQRFRDPRITENVLPIWFKHGASHHPPAWKQHDVPALI